jgi:protein-tyrosine-phosphatase
MDRRVDSPQPFHVLYVCTGNICRSAVAERLLRMRLREHLGEAAALFDVTSAGVQGLSGEPMDADAAAELHQLGGDDAEFTAQRLDADQIGQADLILTANRKHRSSVVRVDASAARRTFTIREFALLAEHVDLKALPDVDPSTRLQAVVEEVAATRGTVRPDERTDFDVEDPYGGSQALHRHIAVQIDAATTTTAGLLIAAARHEEGPKPGPGPPPPDDSDESTETEPAANTDRATPPTLAPVALPAAATEADENPGGEARAARKAAGGSDAKPTKKKVRRRWWFLSVVVLVVALFGAAGWVAWSGLSAKHELEASRPLVSQARQQVLDGDTTQARATVKKLQGHTSKARTRTHGPIWRIAAKAPFVGQDVTAVRTTTQAIDDVAQRVLPPLLDTSDTIRPEKLRTAGNRINLAPLEAAAPALRSAATRTNTIKTRVDDINTQGLTGTVARAVVDVRKKIDDLAATVDDAARAAELIPPMLGADGPRRYFLAFQNPAEARGTGGLLGAYGVLEATDGRIRVRHLGSNTELTNPKKLPIDPGADFRALYGRTPPWWVNGNISPHFPDAGRIWTAMWQQEFGQNLDGVIATDPVALGYMLKATGPAPLPGGGQITAGNAVALTMKDVYERYPSGAENPVRDAYLQGVAGAVFARLLSGEGDPKALADQLGQAVGERRLLLYSTHQDEQRQLEQTSLAGAVPRTARPFAGLVVNNYSGSKLDYYLDRTLDYRRSSCPAADGTTTSRITVTLTNAAPKGLPAYVDQQLDAASFRGKPPHSANTDYVEVLATNGAELSGATIDGKALLVTGAQAQGHAVFAFNATLFSGQTRTIVLQLTEPPTQGSVELMEPQPLVRPMAQRASLQACRVSAKR